MSWCCSRQLLVVLSVLWVNAALPFSLHAEDSALRVFPGEYIVEPAPQAQALSSLGMLTMRGVAAPTELKDLGFGVKLVHSGPNFSALHASSATIGAVPYDPRDSYCSDLLKRGLAKSCSPNFEIHINAVPNDPRFGELWGLSSDKGIDGPRAWEVSTGSTDVVVAVIDTGIDYNHPELAHNVWTNPNEIPGNGIDDDHDGFVDDVHGINAATGSGNPMDDNGHGSHVSGTIGARGDNGIGVAGVNWNVRIMGLKFLDSSGSGSLAAAVQAINYMVLMKRRGVNVRVANNSWGGGGFSQSLHDAIARARDAGIIFVAAAGNESNNNDASPSYPASYGLSNVVSVAAIDKDHNLAGFSNYGESVTIAAPGVGILSTTPNNSYERLDGTSMATPHVTGAFALLFASEPNLSNGDAIARLSLSGVTIPSLAGLVGTSRMLNIGRLLHNENEALPAPTPTPIPCQVTVDTIPYAPDTAADTSDVVMRADEYNYYILNLPFVFPFHNQAVQTVYISPNGVVYTQRAPTGMDYENGSIAPLNAIAALQSDLVADSAPYGVRVGSAQDHVTIYWKVKHYAVRGLGDIDVHLSLYADGHVESFYSFGEVISEAYVGAHATVGLTGPTAASAKTYSYNDATLLHSNLGVRFTQQCDASVIGAANVSQVKLRGYHHRKVSKSATAGQGLQIALSGSGYGNVTVQAAFNGRVCPSTASATLINGAATLLTVVPKVPAALGTLTIQTNGKKGIIRIHNAAARSARAKKKAVSARALSHYCSDLLGRLHTTP